MHLFSDDWLRALDAAASTDEELRAATADLDLLVNHAVGPDIAYHVSFHRGTVRFRPGLAPEAQVTFTQDQATAEGLATGALSAQHAFMTGRLRVAGDLALLTRLSGVFGKLSDVFATTRSATTVPDHA